MTNENSQQMIELGRKLSELQNHHADDPSELLRNRFLCREGVLGLYGQTGIGKSSFSMQCMILWLRNFDRRDWSLCVPYDMGGIKGFYPDLIIIRKTSKGLIADILEPHNPSFVDTVPKAIGLAKFADEHGEEFGRIIIARKKGEQWQYADLQDKQSRERIKAMQPGSDVAKLFEA